MTVEPVERFHPAFTPIGAAISAGAGAWFAGVERSPCAREENNGALVGAQVETLRAEALRFMAQLKAVG